MRYLIAAISAMLLSPATSWAMPEPERFVVCYGSDAPLDEFAPYARAVLDGDHHPPLPPLKARGMHLFGYLSLGEADAGRPYYRDTTGFLLGPNPDWPGAHYVDIRKPGWHSLVLDRLVPDLLAQGFDGLFLDTLDDAAFLEHADPVGNRGMIQAAAALVHDIHTRYPTAPLMLNRAYDVGTLVAADLESILAESLTSTFDFKTHRYSIRKQADLDWGLARISELRQRNPSLRLYTLDYWDPADSAGVARLYDRERKAGFIPYVASIDLQHVIPEPVRPGRRAAR